MKFTILQFLPLFLILLPFQGNVQLQTSSKLRLGDTTQVHVLNTIRGDVFQGILIHFDVSDVVFLLEKKDTLRYKPSDIDSVYVLPKMKNREHVTIRERLLVSPTGFGLDKGEDEYRNLMLFYNAYHHGVTDKISVGGGIMPLISDNYGWVDAKVSFELHKSIHFSIGGIVRFEKYKKERVSSFANVLGALTIGSEENFINFCLLHDKYGGWPYSIGLALKIGERHRFFCEFDSNITRSDYWATTGIALFGRSMSLDAGFLFFPFSPEDEGPITIVVPVLAFAKRF